VELLLWVYSPSILAVLVLAVRLVKNKHWYFLPPLLAIVSNFILVSYIEQITTGDPGYMFPVGHILIPFIVIAIWLVTTIAIHVFNRIMGTALDKSVTKE